MSTEQAPAAPAAHTPKRPTKNPRPSDVVNIDLLSDDALITKRQIRASVYCVSEPTFWRRVQAGQFPKPIESGGLGLWRVGDVRAFVRAKAQKEAA